MATLLVRKNRCTSVLYSCAGGSLAIRLPPRTWLFLHQLARLSKAISAKKTIAVYTCESGRRKGELGRYFSKYLGTERVLRQRCFAFRCTTKKRRRSCAFPIDLTGEIC